MIATAYKNIDNTAGYLRFTEITHNDILDVKEWRATTSPNSFCAWASDLSSLTLYCNNDEDYLLSLLRWV